MVRTAGRFRIEQVDAALLASGDHQLTSLEGEDRRSHLHVEVSLLQPNPVGGLEPILQRQLVPFDVRADQAVAVNMIGRVIPAIPRRSPSRSARIDGRTAAAPQSPAL